MFHVGDRVRCSNWKDVKRHCAQFEAEGYGCEIRGWDDIENNIITIISVPEEVNVDGVREVSED